MKTKETTPLHCGLCNRTKMPLVRSGVFVCLTCDGWPPILNPPTPDARPHVQGCSHANGPSTKRCICPWNR